MLTRMEPACPGLGILITPRVQYDEIRDILIANPHFVPCPNGRHNPIIDMYSELLEETDRKAAFTGQAAMICPACGEKMFWPRNFLNDPAPAMDFDCRIR